MTTFGIDLGTTNSCIAYIDDSGRPVIINNASGEPTTPSAVYFEGPGKVTVGQAAKDVAVLVPHLVAQLIKREMGHPGQAFTYHNRAYTPEVISAFILRDLARGAEESVHQTVRDVVITVPAYFGVAEREATRRAGQIAGLNVLDVLPEPIAAALSYSDHRLAYSDHRPADGVQHILVFDLGGGTFDTTVIRIDGNEITVICTDGDHRLGGADWDQRIGTYLLQEFTKRYPRFDPTADEQFMQELSIMAESLKRDLSSASVRRRNVRFGGQAVQVELSRAQLEELTADLLERALTITKRTVEEARRKGIADLREAVLVGGMTRMPAIAIQLKERFGLDIKRHEPDLAVARGAALFSLIAQARQTADLGGGTGTGQASGMAAERVAGTLGISRDQAEEIMSLRVATVVPRGFGVKVVDQNDPLFHSNPDKARYYIVHLLPANTPLPASAGPVRFATGMDNQPAADIEVWEQKGAVESEELADNTFVGRGRLRSLVGLPAGSPIEITFSMNETGLLTVHAAAPGSGKEARFELQIGGMDQEAVDEARAMVARHEVKS